MSWLEYLGLEYLLSDDNHLDFSGLGSGMLFLFGLFCWLIVGIFQGDLVDQGAAVFNLLASIILLVLTIIKYVKMYKNKDNSITKKIFYGLSFLVLVASFIYGLIKPYHTLLFNYDYKNVFSGIAMLFYPLIILNLLFPFFCENKKLGRKIEAGFETLGLAFITLVVVFLLSQVVTLFVSFTKTEGIYGNFISYHNVEITRQRKNWEYKSVQECIEKLLPTDAKTSLEEFINSSTTMKQYKENGDLEGYQKNLLSYIHKNYPIGKLSSNSISYASMKWEEDYIVTYVLRDKEYNKLYYVKFNYKDYSIIDFVDSKYYESIKAIKL